MSDVDPCEQKSLVVKCCFPGVHEHALTYGKSYPVLAYDEPKRQYRVQGDHGRRRWFGTGHFVAVDTPTPKFVTFQTDRYEHDIEVSIWFDDGSWGWLRFGTPEYVTRALLSESPFHDGRVVFVPDVRTIDVGDILRTLQGRGNLVALTQAKVDAENPEPPRDLPKASAELHIR